VSIPSYRKHSRKGVADVACVDIPTGDGRKAKRFYLGAFGSELSRQRYNCLIGEWIKTGSRALPVASWSHSGTDAEASALPAYVSAARVAAQFLRYLRANKRDGDGKLKDPYNVLQSLRTLRDVLRHRNMVDLTSHELDGVQTAMVKRGWAIQTIIDRMRYVRAAVMRSVKAGDLPIATMQHLQLVERVTLSTATTRKAQDEPQGPQRSRTSHRLRSSGSGRSAALPDGQACR
jgi:hypothetical protein